MNTKPYFLIPVLILLAFISLQAVKAQCSVCYVQQDGVTFSAAHSYGNITYNVTALPQTDINGYGPAYLLNGLSSTGFWYEVGISLNFNGPGSQNAFRMDYAVWSSNGTIIFPSGTILGNASLSCNINAGDIVGLSLAFVSNDVVMSVKDWNTSCYYSLAYSSEGSKQFLGNTYSGVNGNGFFTGLMTEWRGSSSQFAAQEKEVYTSSWLNATPPTGLLWINEYYITQKSSVVYDSYPYSSNSSSITYQETNESYNKGTFTTGSITPNAITVENAGLPNTVTYGTCTISAWVNISGGTPPYTYYLLINSTTSNVSQKGVSKNSLSAAASAVSYYTYHSFDYGCGQESYGEHSYSIFIEDSDGHSASTKNGTIDFLAPFRVSLGVAPEIDVNHSEHIVLNYSGGTPPYKFTVHMDGIQYGTTTNFTFSTPGTHEVYVNVTDKNGDTATSATYPFTVNSLPSINITPARSFTEVGFPLKIYANVTGGSAPYNISWYESNLYSAGRLLGYGSNISVTPANNETFSVYAKLVDADNYSTQSKAVIISVYPALEFSSYEVIPSSFLLYTNSTAKGEISAAGGVPPYTYYWYINNALYATTQNSSITLDLNNAQQNSVYATVHYSLGNVVIGQTYTIDASLNYVNIGLIAGGVIGCAVAALLVFTKLRRRAKRRRVPQAVETVK